jgi:hypothetical protein
MTFSSILTPLPAIAPQLAPVPAPFPRIVPQLASVPPHAMPVTGAPIMAQRAVIPTCLAAITPQLSMIPPDFPAIMPPFQMFPLRLRVPSASLRPGGTRRERQHHDDTDDHTSTHASNSSLWVAGLTRTLAPR